MTNLHNIIQDALFDGRIAYLDSRNLVAKRIKNIIQKCAPDIEGVDDRTNIHVLVYDSCVTKSSFVSWVAGCFQKIQNKRLVYSSIHQVIASAGRVIIVLITA